ncbi:MAG TPA: winged helix-turn-helix transcriptional regulator [Candidatus Thermoplasmatota archaeon]|nr:winged helix-turn-helix transcriptional regulator [Candidatus Thermoplasmatota archaeon]
MTRTSFRTTLRIAVPTGLTLAFALPAAAMPSGLGALPQAGLAGLGLAGAGAGLASLLGGLSFLSVGGLRHVSKENVLDHPMRRSLLEMVMAEPGIHLRELASRHGTAVTNTQWHLRKLEQAGLVRTQKAQGRRLYYPVQGGVTSRDKAMQNAASRNPNAGQLLDFLANNPGANQKALAEGLQMNPGTVRWHLRRLEQSGMIRSIEEGNMARYFLVSRPARPAAGRPTPTA